MKNNLKHFRGVSGLTLEGLAVMAGTTKSYIWELENERAVPGLKRAYSISKALHRGIEDVFPDKQEYKTETVTRTIKVK